MDDDDVEAELSGAQEKIERRRARRLTAAQCMQWRWMWRALFGSLFEPYVVNVFLKGTWLFNAWLRLMGADVSMGALVLGKVSDHGLVKVRNPEKDGFQPVVGIIHSVPRAFTIPRWSRAGRAVERSLKLVVHSQIEKHGRGVEHQLARPRCVYKNELPQNLAYQKVAPPAHAA